MATQTPSLSQGERLQKSWGLAFLSEDIVSQRLTSHGQQQEGLGSFLRMGSGETHLAPITHSFLNFLVIWFTFSPEFLHIPTSTMTAILKL